MARTYCPDIILLDLRMPKMDGRTAAVYLKQDEITKNIPIIILTASAVGENLENLQSLCDGILHKPVSRSQLVFQLEKILPPNENFFSINIVSDHTELLPIHLKNVEKMPDLVEKLGQEAEKPWQKLQKTMKRPEIQTFAQKLRHLATEYQCTILLNYVTTLEMQLAAFDWEHLPKTVEQYPQVWRSLI